LKDWAEQAGLDPLDPIPTVPQIIDQRGLDPAGFITIVPLSTGCEPWIENTDLVNVQISNLFI
jgi:hypothetical protein